MIIYYNYPDNQYDISIQVLCDLGDIPNVVRRCLAL